MFWLLSIIFLIFLLFVAVSIAGSIIYGVLMLATIMIVALWEVFLFCLDALYWAMGLPFRFMRALCSYLYRTEVMRRNGLEIKYRKARQRREEDAKKKRVQQ